MNQLFSKIKETLETAKNPFRVETNKLFEDQTCDLFATRIAGMAGKDFVFIHDLEKTGSEKNKLQAIHEASRKYANSFYKMPKWFRFKVPNIVSVFIAGNGLTQELKSWAEEPTRTITGGEFHSVFFIDLKFKAIYGHGKNRTYVPDVPFISSLEFKNVDPQNRAFYIVAMLADKLLQ
jgi:hypothetical protein